MNEVSEALMIHPEVLIWSYLVVINLISFAVMGLDKQLARRKKNRISEETLFFTALIFGSAGGIAGMWLFRHKTKHWIFVYGLPVLLVIQAVVLILILI
jgi:uncharacterized membrane protein YsdA (DUF1294 family)